MTYSYLLLADNIFLDNGPKTSVIPKLGEALS